VQAGLGRAQRCIAARVILYAAASGEACIVMSRLLQGSP